MTESPIFSLQTFKRFNDFVDDPIGEARQRGRTVTTVSVIIPARNAAQWIQHAICSVTSQTLMPCEIIVIDDGSTDDTCKVVGQMQEVTPELVLVRNRKKLGAAASRNIGMLRATGDWIAFLDADDWFAPTRLRRLIDLGEQEGASMVADNQYFTCGPGEYPLRTLLGPKASELEMVDLESFLRRDRIVDIGNLGLLKPIFRRHSLQTSGVRYDDDPALVIGEDSLFLVSCLITGERIVLIPEALYFYRRHAASLTHSMTADSVRIFVTKNRELLARLRFNASSSLAKAIDQTFADQDNILAYFELVELLRQHQWLTTLLRLLSSRGHTLFLLRRATRGLMGRISESRLRQSIVTRMHAVLRS